jgi:hypothetical protein
MPKEAKAKASTPPFSTTISPTRNDTSLSFFPIYSPIFQLAIGFHRAFGIQKEKVTKKKDPNAPKKALSPYMFFTQEWREKIKEESPGISFGMQLIHSPIATLILRPGEVAKRLGSKWKSMSDEEKDVRPQSLASLFHDHLTKFPPLAICPKAPGRQGACGKGKRGLRGMRIPTFSNSRRLKDFPL